MADDQASETEVDQEQRLRKLFQDEKKPITPEVEELIQDMIKVEDMLVLYSQLKSLNIKLEFEVEADGNEELILNWWAIANERADLSPNEDGEYTMPLDLPPQEGTQS